MAQDDLFSSPAPLEPAREEAPKPQRHAPLAARMRPRTLAEYVGQTHILGPGMLLRRAIEADRIQSLIFYGPPGTGQTSPDQITALHTSTKYESLSGGATNLQEMGRM